MQNASGHGSEQVIVLYFKRESSQSYYDNAIAAIITITVIIVTARELLRWNNEWISLHAVSISKRRITENLGDVFDQLSWQGGWIICIKARHRGEDTKFCFDNLQIYVSRLITISCHNDACWVCVQHSWVWSGSQLLNNRLIWFGLWSGISRFCMGLFQVWVQVRIVHSRVSFEFLDPWRPLLTSIEYVCTLTM